MPSLFQILFAMQVLLHHPVLDDGIEPVMQPVLAASSELEIGPITPQDIELIYFRWGVKNERLIWHTSVRLGVIQTPSRFMNVLGNVESAIADDLLVLIKSSEGSFGMRVSRVQKIRYKMAQ